MTRIPFHQLPILTQVSTLGSLFMAWVMIEEFEIDRHHWDRLLPLYKYGNLCLYDLAAITVIVAAWALFLRRRWPRAAPPTT